MPSIQTWFLIGLGTLVSSAGFEQLRFMITKPHRKNALNEYWQHSLNVSTIFDYLLLPITYLISWLDDGIVSNGSAGSNSLKIAGRWINPFHEWEDRNTADIFAYLKWQVTRKNRNGVPVENLLKITLPVEIPDFNLLFKNCYNSNAELHAEERVFTVTWMGQSTLFVQIDGYNILTDPMFSSRTMGEWFGAKRLRPVPCSLIDLPPVDIVLVSHNHYDHLDLSSIYEIGNNAIWYVPKGLSNWLNGYGVTNVVDLDWWEEYHHDDNLTIVGLPCQHWSGRHFFDVNITLWSSFLVKSRTNSNSFFHCGDSGYCPSFKEVGFKYGPVTLAATPIGSYEPRYFMSNQHMNPEEAVMVHLDLKAKYSIGVHWGTFLMSDEHYLDPPKEFEMARLGHSIEKGRVFTSTFGKTIILESDPTSPNSTQSLNTAESYMTYSLQSLNTISDSHQSSHPSDNMTQSMTIDSNQSEI